jgi:hypothetical protein
MHDEVVVVFAVLAHEDPVHLARLASRLAPYRLVVHLDRKSNRASFEAALGPVSNVELLPRSRSFDVRWAGMSVMQAEFAVLERCAQLTDPDDYVVLCSGADYPLRPVADLERHLASSGGTQFIRYYRIGVASARLRWSVDRRHYNDWRPLGRPRTVPHRRANTAIRLVTGRLATHINPPKPPQGVDPVYGSQWVALTGRCITDALALRTRALDEYFSHTYAPDEKYLHTLVSLTEHHRATTDGGYSSPPLDNDTTPAWMANLHHLHPSLTKWYTLDDWDEVSETDMWFLRKVRSGDGSTLMDRIDEVRLL